MTREEFAQVLAMHGYPLSHERLARLIRHDRLPDFDCDECGRRIYAQRHLDAVLKILKADRARWRESNPRT